MTRYLIPIFFVSFYFFLQPGEGFGNPGPSPCTRTAPDSIPPIGLRSIAEDLSSPVGLTHAGDRSGRLFIVEQDGTIRILSDGRVSPKPFLDIREKVNSGGEKGLLGLAFHPDYRKNGRFFVNYTTRDLKSGLQTRISEFKTGKNPDEADASSERILLTFSQPYGNHNGGAIAFGPDGFLYIGTGDGGSADDPTGNGQSLNTLLGKILRIDVDQKEGGKQYRIPKDNPFVSRENTAPEIWAYGLRNPWRFSFDALTGRLYAGDVGQNEREEIDIIEKGKNYGWNIMEGKICTPGVNPKCRSSGLEPPILDYPRSVGTTVIGGYVYRGASVEKLCGTYLYADFGNGVIFGLIYDGKKVAQNQKMVETGRYISSFGQDEMFELYITDHRGKILKVVSGSEQSPQKPDKKSWFPFFN